MQGDIGFYKTLQEAFDACERDAKRHHERFMSVWSWSGNSNSRVWRRLFGYGNYTIETLKFGDMK